uniref:Mating-type protein beta 1 n=1 Tax=Coprinopsis cinerea TaxID=5346 RepID=Q9Y7A2_COPCI|nr:mating-type protein beta 1 [Coprinopsis cinerea]
MAIPLGAPAGDSADTIVRRTIESLRKDFLAMIRGGSANSLTAFLDACSQFDTYVHSCHDSLSDETMDLLLEFSVPLATLSDNMVELEDEKKPVADRFPEDIIGILTDQASHMTLAGESESSTTPLYVQPCARWLKDNWHNPYPSPQTRSHIATQTHALRKDIDAWFIDARRRIGWNDLRRKYFDNKRANIVQAAAIFVSSDPTSDGLPSHLEIEFASVLARATSLYDERFSQSTLACKLDNAVRDMTPALKEQLKIEKARKRQEERMSSVTNKRARHAYPTPERSPPAAAELLASPSLSVIDLTYVDESPSIGRKRRRSLRSDDDDAKPPLCKRSRSQSIRRELSPVNGLPSPAASTQEELSELSTAMSPQRPSLPQSISTDGSKSTGKRKRRLSDGFQYPATKRPQMRPQTVSDPLPIANVEDWDRWFQEHVLSSPELTLTGDIPSPVTVDAPDSSTPLDIQLFNFPLIPDLPPSAPAAPAPTAELNVLEPLEAPTLSLDLTLPWMDNSFAQPLQPTISVPASNNLYINSAAFSTLDATTSQPFSNADGSAFLHDPSLWSDVSVPDLDFSTLFNQPSTISATPVPIFVPPQPSSSTTKALSEQEREAKRKELEELEARAQAIRAEISVP